MIYQNMSLIIQIKQNNMKTYLIIDKYNANNFTIVNTNNVEEYVKNMSNTEWIIIPFKDDIELFAKHTLSYIKNNN